MSGGVVEKGGTPASITADAARIGTLLGRLGWATTSISLVAVLLVAACFYWLQIRPQADATALARQNEAAERVVSRVQALVGQIERILATTQAWAVDGFARIDDAATFNQLLIPVLQQRSVISSVHLATDEGREILLLATPEGFKNRITDVPGKGTQQHWLSWTDARTRVGEEWKAQDYDPRRRPWFSGAMATAENVIHWTAPYIFQSTKDPGITASVRWTDKASGRQFVVAFDILLSDFSRSTRELSYGRTGQVAVVTGDGKVIGLPRNAGFDSDEIIRKSVLQMPEEIGLSALAAALQRATDGDDQTLRVASTGEDWLVTLKRIPFGSQSFRVAMLAPESDFSPWSLRLVSVMLLLLSAVAVLSVVFSRKLARDVTQPLGKVFDELAAGNRELAMQGKRTATVADLAPCLQNADSFAALAQALLAGLARYLPVGQGSLYRVTETATAKGDEDPGGPEAFADPDAAVSHSLRLCGGYARGADLLSVAEIAFGEGLVGQCAVEQRAIRIERPPAGYLRISSALASGEPAALVLLPVASGGALVGVLEVALLPGYADEDIAVIESLVPMLALCMEVIARNEGTQALLRASLAQADELARHQERIQLLLAEQGGIFDNAPMGILYIQNGLICRANAEVALLLDRPVDELVGSEVAGLFGGPQRYREFNQAISQRMADGVGVRQEWSLPAKGGGAIAVMIAIQRFRIEGVERSSIWTIEDISERKALEDATRASEASLRQVLEESPAAVTIVSEDGEQIFVNRRLADLLGVPQALIKARRSSEFWADPDERQSFVKRLKDEGRIDDYETRFCRADGKIIRVVLNTRWIEQGGKRLLLTWMFEIVDRPVEEH